MSQKDNFLYLSFSEYPATRPPIEALDLIPDFDIRADTEYRNGRINKFLRLINAISNYSLYPIYVHEIRAIITVNNILLDTLPT